MSEKEKGKYIGALGALLIHLTIIALLLFLTVGIPERVEESGVTVMMGDVADAYGGFDPSSLVEVEPEPSITEEVPEAESDPAIDEPEMITQTEEETIVVQEKPKQDPKPEQPKPTTKPETPKPDEEARKRAEEARKQAELKAEQDRQAAAAAANNLIAGSFNKGSQMESSGVTSGSGNQGSPNGNSKEGEPTGTGGYGDFNLGGRSLGSGGLPQPTYNVQEEGKVVVTITVNPGGYVIATSIHRTTNTVSPALRKAAEEAAKKAKFNAVDDLNNQTGTITYFFKLK